MELRTLERRIAEIRQNGQMTDLTLFRNFSPEVYNV